MSSITKVGARFGKIGNRFKTTALIKDNDYYALIEYKAKNNRILYGIIDKYRNICLMSSPNKAPIIAEFDLSYSHN